MEINDFLEKNKILLAETVVILTIIALVLEIFSRLKPISKYIIPLIKYHYLEGILFGVVVGIIILSWKYKRKHREKQKTINKLSTGSKSLFGSYREHENIKK